MAKAANEPANDDDISPEVQKIIDEGNKEMLGIVKKAMKETFVDYADEKIDEYAGYVLKWDSQFDELSIDPARIINGWIEVILKLKKIKKELKKKEADQEKRDKLLKKKMKNELLNEYKKEFLNDNLKKNKKKLTEKDIKNVANEVFKWHNEILGKKDVNKFVKTWVDVESKLQPIRDKIFKLQVKQEDKEYEIEKKKAEEEAAKKKEEDRIKREKEREEKKKERERLKKEAEEKRIKEEAERKEREEYEKKPKFTAAPKKRGLKKGKWAKTFKNAKDFIAYIKNKNNKGTQFVVMYEKKNGKKLKEFITPNFVDKFGDKYHFLACPMDDDLTKAAKVWFDAWDLYTINAYPCFGILLNGVGTLQEHIFFTNFENGCKKLTDLFDDCVHLNSKGVDPKRKKKK